MSKGLEFKELKKAIDTAENVLLKLANKDDEKSLKKHRKVSRALENGYKCLNNENTSQKDLDNAAAKIWKALEDDDTSLIIWIFLFGFLLSAAMVFTAYHTYSFIDSNWNEHHHHLKDPELTEGLSKLITVNYEETNIVNLKNLMTVSDAEGLKNPAQEFHISNDDTKLKNVDYKVIYNINIVELNSGIENLLDKKYIKFRLIHTDEDGNEILEPIRTFADLEENADGTFQMFTGEQAKNSNTDFKVIIWLGANATNDQQNRAYTFAFKINAAIANN